MSYRKLWIAFALVVLISFSVLGWFGREIYVQAPPLPVNVVDEDGNVIFTGDQIKEGQNVWQSIGGQEVGSVWGHGAYVAPDWTADWLHREAVLILDTWAERESSVKYDSLQPEDQAKLKARLAIEIRENTYDESSGTITVTRDRANAMQELVIYYTGLFGDDPAFDELRNQYAIAENALDNAEYAESMSSFFFWASWACSTNRPGSDITYTNNWPPEELIDNRPSGHIIVWSVISVVVLLAGIGALVWFYSSRRNDGEQDTPKSDPLINLSLTPSMRATLKYFWVVALLVIIQALLGAVTAHFGVEGNMFYGIPISEWLPYAVTRTWHVQLGIFWIATAWLATGLFIAPAVSGYEPKFQKFGVDFLFIALLIIVFGSMAGEWLSVQQHLGLLQSFWFGHQGYEYIDLGRFWQIFLLIGLVLWLVLVGRALMPAFKKLDDSRHLLAMFLISAVAIALFYAAGLMWGRHTNLAIAEYWRWWVVHLWVEGFFEVFATVVIAFLFTRLGLLRVSTATYSVLFSTAIYLSGGIIGTFHHLYFTGTPTAVLALGATFSALEVVPLVLIGREAIENLSLKKLQPWVSAYRWPINFFVAVAFWNLVGAGLFGFLINPPIALYYMQGLNTTPVHGHTALFGVYGMLGLGLLLFCLRGLTEGKYWDTKLIKFAFWATNIGLALMVLLSLLPIGLMQTWASVEYGMWYARSAEFLQTPVMNILRWMRIVGDSIFAIGLVAFGWFVFHLSPKAAQRKN